MLAPSWWRGERGESVLLRKTSCAFERQNKDFWKWHPKTRILACFFWRMLFPLWTVLLSPVLVWAVRFATLKVTFYYCLVFPARVLLSFAFGHLSCPVCLTRGGWVCFQGSISQICFCFLHVCFDIVSQWHSHWRVQGGGQSATHDSEKFAKIGEKEGKKIKKNWERKGKI